MDVREKIEVALREKLGATRVEVEDDSGRHAGHRGARDSGGGHYRVTVESPLFSTLSPVARHRAVYKALGHLLPGDIHALAIAALGPEEKA